MLFNLFIYMFHYYIREFSSNDIWKVVDKYPHTIKEKKIIVSKDGMYKIHNDNMYRYKLISTNCDSVSEFVGKYTLLVNQFVWKKEIIYKIPFLQQGIQYITFDEYIIHPKIKFIIEKMNNKIIDFYFKSNLSYHTHIMKEELTSFLSLLK